MKAQKVDNIRFSIDQGFTDLDIDIKSREGELYLSLSNLLFKEGKRFYEIPIEKLQDIRITGREPLEIEFTVPSIIIKVHGHNAERLLALRHLLLPYLEGKYLEEKPLPNVLNVWSLGIKKTKAISDLLKIPGETVEMLICRAKEEGLIENDKITGKGMRYLNKNSEYIYDWEG